MISFDDFKKIKNWVQNYVRVSNGKILVGDKTVTSSGGSSGFEPSELATVATTGAYTDLVGAPKYVVCTLSAYNAMQSHDSDTYYIIIADGNA